MILSVCLSVSVTPLLSSPLLRSLAPSLTPDRTAIHSSSSSSSFAFTILHLFFLCVPLCLYVFLLLTPTAHTHGLGYSHYSRSRLVTSATSAIVPLVAVTGGGRDRGSPDRVLQPPNTCGIYFSPANAARLLEHLDYWPACLPTAACGGVGGGVWWRGWRRVMT